MGRSNKYGLARYIPEVVKAEVRRRSMFGCVVCGSIPYEYDHVRVQWTDATEHDPEDMVLLCDSHHKQKTNKLLRVEDIEVALRLRRSDAAAFSFKLAATSQKFAIHWPYNNIIAVDNAIVVNGNPILRIEAQENPLEPVLLSGSFSDLRGNMICVIEKNEIVSSAGAIGDFSLVGNRFRYKTPNNTESLQFVLDPSGIIIEKIFHANGDAFVKSEDGFLIVGNVYNAVGLRNSNILDCSVAIEIVSTTDNWDFIEYDLSKRNYMSMTGSNFVSGRTGIQVDGRRRKGISYTFRW